MTLCAGAQAGSGQSRPGEVAEGIFGSRGPSWTEDGI